MQNFQIPTIKMLHPLFIEEIVNKAIDVLGKVGVIFENKEAIMILAEAGCNVKNGTQVFFREDIIRAQLKTVPAKFTLYDREKKAVITLGGEAIQFNPGSSALKILDSQSQQQRDPQGNDLRDFAHLTQHLQHIAVQSTALVPTDVPREIADRYRLYIALLYCSKPIITGTFTHDGFAVMQTMLEVVRNSKDELTQFPLAVFDCCPTSPLRWSELTCQNLIDSARYGIPVEIVPMPMTGATSPGTIAGTLVQQIAENLSGVVLTQLIRAGTPVIIGGSPTAFDLRFGTTPMGAIETMMIDTAHAAIAKYLNIPVHAYMGLSDSKLLDAQSGLETGMGAVLASLSGINMISGPGMLDFQTCQSLEKLVIDNEICGMALRLKQGIQKRSSDIAEDLYGDIRDGEHFLTSPTTLTWMRDEFTYPSEIIERHTRENWLMNGQQTIFERSHQNVLTIIQNNNPVSIPAEKMKELQKIMALDANHHSMTTLPKIS